MSIAPSEEAKRAYAATRAEVEHLQARLSAVTAERERLRAALANLIGWQPKDENGDCYYCGRTFEDYDGPRDPHAADCPITRGRGALQETL